MHRDLNPTKIVVSIHLVVKEIYCESLSSVILSWISRLFVSLFCLNHYFSLGFLIQLSTTYAQRIVVGVTKLHVKYLLNTLTICKRLTWLCCRSSFNWPFVNVLYMHKLITSEAKTLWDTLPKMLTNTLRNSSWFR